MRRVKCSLFAALLCLCFLLFSAESNAVADSDKRDTLDGLLQYAEDNDAYSDASLTEAEPGGSMTGEMTMIRDDINSSSITNLSLVSDGRLVWWIDDGMILCDDPVTGENGAAIPLPDLCDNTENVEYAALTSWQDDTVMLLLCVRTDQGEKHVELKALKADDGEVRVIENTEETEALEFLFNSGTEWNELKICSCGQRIILEALDSKFMMRIYIYEFKTRETKQLIEMPFVQYLGGIPYGENYLLIQPELEDESQILFTEVSLKTGETSDIGSMYIDSPISAANFVYSNVENRLFFTVNSTAYAVTPGEEERGEAIAAFSAVPELQRRGTVVGNHYVVWDETGEFLYCDTHGHLIASNLRIADPSGAEAVAEAAKVFGIKHPGFTVSVIDSESEEEIAESIQNNSAEYDLFVLELNSELYKQMMETGHLANMSGSTILLSAAEDLQNYLQSALLEDDMRFASFPVSILTVCQTLNVPAMQDLTGVSRENLPTDWTSFLKALRKIASKGSLKNNSELSLYGMNLTAEEFRETMFSWLIQDSLLWLEKDSARIERLQKTLLPALEAFNRIDWNRLGLTEEAEIEDGGLSFSPGIEHCLLMDGVPEITVMDLAEGEEFWPLSVGDNERLVAQIVSVICINPNSENIEAALQFAETVWDCTDIATKMSLCQSMDRSILNEDYEEDLAYLEELATSLSHDIEAAESLYEKEALLAEQKELTEFIEDYRENAYWLITEDSIAAYRALTDQMVVISNDLWGMEDEDSPGWRFLAGELSPKQFVRQMTAQLIPLVGDNKDQP